MRLAAAIAVFLLATTLPANEGVLKGVVKENELGGSTMANVAISALGANPTQTGQYGEFTLIFPTKKPGETVLVSVSKSDYQPAENGARRPVLRKTPPLNGPPPEYFHS